MDPTDLDKRKKNIFSTGKKENRMACRFVMTWWWVNDDIIQFIFRVKFTFTLLNVIMTKHLHDDGHHFLSSFT